LILIIIIYSLLARKAGHTYAMKYKPTLLEENVKESTLIIIKLFDQINELANLEAEQKAKIEDQENHIVHLEFMPDGPKYIETKDNFDLSVIDGNKLR
jgi:hypothetical protein